MQVDNKIPEKSKQRTFNYRFLIFKKVEMIEKTNARTQI